MRRGQKCLTRSLDKEMVEQYLAGDSQSTIAKRYGVNQGCIQKRFKRLGVEARSVSEGKRLFSLDESAFDQLTPESEYWVGFLMADGCVHYPKSGGSAKISLTLTEEDGSHIESFRQFLKADYPLHYRPARKSRAFKPGGRPVNVKPSAGITITSTKMANSLASFGVAPRKSLTAKVLKLEDSRDFWRGAVDGDGFVFFPRDQRPVFGLVGSKPMLDQFREFFGKRVPKCDVPVTKHYSIWRFSVSGQFAKDAVSILYDECKVALPRKLLMARRAMAWEPKPSWYAAYSRYNKDKPISPDQLKTLSAYPDHLRAQVPAR